MRNKATFVPFERNPKGQELRDIREELGLTQREVAELFGISYGTVCSIENDRVTNRLTFVGYAALLERYYALKYGYVPSYRKVGTSTFKDEI